MGKEIIKQGLDNYLEFDSDLLFDRSFVDFASVFGGATRDIVAGDADKINDIDIIGMPKSFYHIHRVLEENGYKRLHLIKPDLYKIYKNIQFIFEPITLVNKNHKIVQLIRPSMKNCTPANSKPGSFNGTRSSYINLLKNVDLSSSGLFYDGEDVYESVKDAYVHCKSKVFETQMEAMMFNLERTFERKRKLVQDQKWFELVTKENGDKETVFKLQTRKLKMNQMKRYNIPSMGDYIEKMKIYGERKEGQPEKVIIL